MVSEIHSFSQNLGNDLGKRKKKEVPGRLTKCHTHTDIRALHHPCELFKTDFPVPIHIRLHDRLVHNLLQLHILQVTTHHHLQNNEELAIRDITVAIDVVHLEGEAELLFLIAFGAEGAETRHEFLEVDVAATVLIENGYHSIRDEVRYQAMSLWGNKKDSGMDHHCARHKMGV